MGVRRDRVGDVLVGILYAAVLVAFFALAFYVCGAEPPGKR